MGRHRRGVRPEDSLIQVEPPDWRKDPRLRWTPRDQLRWALWVSQCSQEDLASDTPYRGSGREVEHYQHDRLFKDRGDRVSIGTKDDLWQDLRFEVALFAIAVASTAP